jgi:hypothetical protein
VTLILLCYSKTLQRSNSRYQSSLLESEEDNEANAELVEAEGEIFLSDAVIERLYLM